jgi:hypothetical protein
MPNGDGSRLGLRAEDTVVVGYVTDLYELLRSIDEVIPKDAVLSIEGTSVVPAIGKFLETRAVANPPEIKPGTLSPKPHFFHLPLEGTNLAELRALADNHAEPEIADHLVVYRGNDVLLSAYDAGDGEVCLSRSLPPDIIERFSAALDGFLRDRMG